MLGIPWLIVYQFLGYFFGHAENCSLRDNSLFIAKVGDHNHRLAVPRSCHIVAMWWRHTRGSFAFVLTRNNKWAGSMPSIGIFAGSMQTKGGGFCFSSESKSTTVICWHLGGTVKFFTAVTKQAFSCEGVASEQGLAGSCSPIRRTSFFVGWGLRPALPSGNTVSAACLFTGMLHTGHLVEAGEP